MFASFRVTNPFRFGTWSWGSSPQVVQVKPVGIHDVETSQEKPGRALKHLLKLNHVNFSICYHNLQYHNHMPHILSSAYILGAGYAHLNRIYEAESKDLDKWVDSPGEISKHDWRDYLGDPKYQRAFVDFFEDELVVHGYDWREVVNKYLFRGEEPLVNCLVAGLAHPLIHLGYAFEISSRELAMEALGLAATQYNFLHKYLDDSRYTKLTVSKGLRPLDILQRVSKDERLDGIADHHGSGSMRDLFTNYEEILLEYWNLWQIEDPTAQFQESQHDAITLLMATPRDGEYNFFFVHLLTSSHALRIILPLIPADFHVSLVRQWWLIALALYCIQSRPPLGDESYSDENIKDRSWKWVETEAIAGKWSLDAHYVKALRAMEVAAQTWGDPDYFYLKAAIEFGESFKGWGGFTSLEIEV